MRIIDKNTDFYDYLQNIYIDKSIVFDRTDSFLLTKEILCENLRYRNWPKRFNEQEYNFLLMQVCNTFWLFLIEILETNNFGKTTKYDIELITSWDNYKKERKLIDISIVEFSITVSHAVSKGVLFGAYDKDKIMKESDMLKQAIDHNDFKIYRKIDSHNVYYGGGANEKITVKHLPLLKACGIADHVDPLDIFLALERYFMLEKSSNERTETVGLTDNEKAENHGFDTKKSFRNIK